MANTYTQIDIQLVFAVKGRESLINSSWKDELFKYITGIIQKNGHKLLRINGMPDHFHIFIGYNPNQLIPKLIEQIKTSSTHFINNNKFSKYKFSWQKGYGAFSYGRSQRNAVANYIDNQEKHHRSKSFKDEYLEFLKNFKLNTKTNTYSIFKK